MTELSYDAIDALMLPDMPLMEDVVDLHHKVLVFDEIDATNEEAKRMLKNGTVEDGVYLMANAQTEARGQQGLPFYSPANTGLYVSMIRTNPDVLHPVTLSRLTFAAAVATAEAIEEAVGVSPKIKWVNDLFYQDRKVCSVSTETIGWLDDRPRATILSVGINCSTVLFPEELMETAGALTTGDIDFIDRNRLAVALRGRLLYWTEHLTDAALLRQYRSRSYLTGKEIMFERGEKRYRGIVKEINDSGNLLVELTSALIRESQTQLVELHSDEVKLISY